MAYFVKNNNFVVPSFIASSGNEELSEINARFAALMGEERDRSFFDDMRLNCGAKNFNFKYIKSVLDYYTPGTLIINYKNRSILCARDYGQTYDFENIKEVISYIIQFDKDNCYIKWFNNLVRDCNYNKFSSLSVDFNEVENNCEIPIKYNIKIKKEKIKDDESWYQPTGVVIIDGNIKNKNKKCNVISKLLEKLCSKNLILKPLVDLCLQRHLDKCNWKCPIKKFHREIENVNHSGYSKLKPQWFGFGETKDKIDKTTEKANTVMDSMNSFLDSMNKKVSSVDYNYKALGWQIFKNLIYFTANPTAVTGAISIAMTIVDIGVANMGAYETLLGPLSAAFSGENKQNQSPKVYVPQDARDWAKRWSGVLNAITSVVLAAFCIKTMPKGDNNEIMKGLFTTARNVGFVSLFFKYVLEELLTFIKRLWDWCIKYIGPSHSFGNIILGESDAVKGWVNDAVWYTDRATVDEVIEDSKASDRVVELHVQGKILISAMIEEGKNMKLFPIVKDLVGKVEKVYEALVNNKRYSPVRFEPYVIWLHGDCNIGKSHITTPLAIRLLKKIGVTARQDCIYTRNAGSKYWNTLNDQPCVWYDDFLCVDSEGASDHVAEYFALKSCAPFNPNMAHLDDKKRYYNPYIVFISSNQDFPKIVKVADEDAFYRRRDSLIKVEKTSPYLNMDLKQIIEKHPEDAAAYKHLQFSKWCRNSGAKGYKQGDGVYTSPMNCDDLFDSIESEFEAHYKRETINYTTRIKQIKALVEETKNESTFSGAMKKFVSKLDQYSRKDHIAVVSDKIKDVMKTLNFVPNMDIPSSEKVEITINKCKEEVKSIYNLPDKTKAIKVKKSSYNSVFDINVGGVEYYEMSDRDECGPIVQMCMHKWIKEISLKISSKYVYRTNICGKRGLVFNDESIIHGGPYTSMIYCQDRIFENCLFVPDEKCSDSNCIYQPESFNRFVHKVYNSARQALTPGDFLIWELPKRGSDESMLRKTQKMTCQKQTNVKKIFDIVYNDYRDKVVIIDDGDKKFTYAKPSNESKTWSWATSFFKVFLGVSKICLFIAGLLIPCYAGYKLGQYFRQRRGYEEFDCEMQDLTVEPQMHPSGDHQQLKLQKSNRTIVKSLEGQMDEQYLDAIRLRVERNTFFITCKEYELQTPIVARCLGIGNNYALCVKHYFDKFRACAEDAEFKILMREAQKYAVLDFDIDELSIKDIKDSGLCIVKLPIRFPQFKNISEMFYDRSDVVSLCRVAELMEVNIGYEKTKVSLRKVNIDYVHDLNVDPGFSTKGWKVVHGFNYQYGGAGVCGSVLISLMKRPKIIGMHTAGGANNRVGVSEFINQHDLENLELEFERIIPQMNDVDQARFQLEGPIIPIGSSKPVRLSDKSKIVPSLIHDYEECYTDVAPLSIRDERCDFDKSPLQYGCEKQCNVYKPWPVKKVDAAVFDLFSILNKACIPARVMSDMSIQQSINGIEIDGYEGMEMNTSEGYPWVLTRPRNEKNKRYLFDFKDDKCVGINNDLNSVLALKEDLRSNGVVPITIFTDCLKDTRILKEKIKIPGKTRVFNIQPVDFTIQCRQYFLDFFVAYRNARLIAENSIGINVNGFEWSELYDHLNLFSNYILCGDFGSYGDMLDCHALFKVFEYICNWYERYIKSIFKVSRKTAIFEIIKALHIAHDLVYMVLNGIPSGFSGTVELNSLINSVLFRIAFVSLTKLSMSEFRKKVRMVSNGDDVIIAVSPDIIDKFNNVTLKDFFKNLNIKYTDPYKGDDIQPFCSIGEAVYLKCNFIPHPNLSNQYLAKLDHKSIVDCYNWIHDTEDKVEATIINCESALRLAYGHGPKYYKNIKKKIFDRVDKMMWISFNYKTWRELDDEIWFNINTQKLVAQMDDGHGKEKVSIDKKDSSVIESQRGESEGSLPVVSNNMYMELTSGGCETLKPVTIQQFSDRWLIVKNFVWATSNKFNEDILYLNLPNDGVLANKTIPSIMPFKVHRYWKGDMEIKVLVNSNKFQVGQLQVSWYYCDYEDRYFSYRDNVYNASQRMHALVNAGASNVAVLKIPYRHYLSSLYTSVVGDYVTQALNLGRLSVKVLNVLDVPSTTYKQCNCTVMVRFLNNCFTGTVDQSLGVNVDLDLTAQMDIVKEGIKLAESLLNENKCDQNRDNPPQFREYNYFVPTASHSFCVGRGDVEKTQCMRLDNTGQTPHPHNLPDEMKISHVAGTFGLLKQIIWNTSHTPGTQLWSCEMAPLLTKTEYPEKVIESNSFRSIPPIGVLSGFFCYWRGDIEFRFDVVASQFHTGKLLVSFIPGLQLDKFDMKKAQGSPYQIFDIQEGRQFVFRCPYIACRPWWPVKYSASDSSVIKERLGTLIVYVLNDLIPMDNVSKTVTINIYQKASDNFELSVMCTPKIGSSNYPVIKNPTINVTHVTLGYNPVFATYSKTYLDAKHLTAYYGNTSGKIAYWTNLKPDTVYIKNATITIDGKVSAHRFQYYNAGVLKEVKYVVRAKNQTYDIVYLFDDITKAKAYITDGVIDGRGLVYSQSGPYEQYEKTPGVWETVPANNYVLWNKEAKFKANIGENTSTEAPVVKLVPPVSTSGFGKLTFGEKIDDLKDICRRYARYFERISFTKVNTTTEDLNIDFPVLPQRLELDTDSMNKVDNLLREGHIALIASGYRFSRGGIRFKIIFTGVNEGEQVLVQFLPDAPCYSDHPHVFKNTEENSNNLFDPGYACMYQGFTVNNCIEFEIPWYLTGEFNLLQRINFPKSNSEKHTVMTEFSSLGNVKVFLHAKETNKSDEQVSASIFYCLADDCRFSTFVGFPPIRFINDFKK